MKKYFKYLIWKPIVVAVFALGLIAYIILPIRFACIFVGILILVCSAYFGLSRMCFYLFKASGPSSYFQDLGYRNVDALIIGSTLAWKYINYEGIYYYDATGFKRNNLMNFNMLKNYFSHLKEHGVIFYIIDVYEAEQLDNYISPCDFQQIHPHIFLQMGISYPAKKLYNPLIYYTIYSFSFLIAYLIRQHGSIKHRSWKKISRKNNLDNSFKEKLAQELDEMIDFCNTRDLVIKIIFIENSVTISDDIEQILRKMNNYIDFCKVSNSQELNNILHTPLQ